MEISNGTDEKSSTNDESVSQTVERHLYHGPTMLITDLGHIVESYMVEYNFVDNSRKTKTTMVECTFGRMNIWLNSQFNRMQI